MLTSRGLMTSEDRISEHPQSGRNRLHIVERGEQGSVLLVKQSLARVRTETWFYDGVLRRLDLAPQCELVMVEHDLVVLDHVRATPLHHIALSDPTRALTILAGLAVPLARLHSRLDDIDRVPAAVLPMPSLDPVELELLMVASSAAIDVITRVQSQPLLGAVVRGAFARPGPAGLIHADLKLDNVLCPSGSGPGGSPAAVVVDWELGGSGPTAWDVGGVIAAMLQIWSAHLALDDMSGPRGWIEGGAVQFSAVQQAASAFVRDYAAAIGPGRNPTLEQVALYTSANLVSRVFAEASQLREITAPQLVRLLMAEGIHDAPDELFGKEP